VALAETYPFLNFIWLMILFFAFVIWFWLLISIFGDIFRRRDIGGGMKALWIIFIVLFWWLGVLIYLIANHDGMSERSMEQMKAQQAQQAEYIQSVAGTSSPADQIASAKQLLDSGTITQAEFDAMKAKALS